MVSNTALDNKKSQYIHDCASRKLVKICTSEPKDKRISYEDKTSTITEIIICFQQEVKFRKSLSCITFLEYISWVVGSCP